MPPAAAKIAKAVSECGGPNRVSRDVAVLAIEDWREFMRHQDDISAEDETAILGTIASKLLELFPTAWTDVITRPEASVLFHDRLKVFIEELVLADGLYVDLDVPLLGSILAAQRLALIDFGELPALNLDDTVTKEYFGCDLEHPAFWGKSIAKPLVDQAIKDGYLIPEMGAGYVVLGQLSIAVRDEPM